MATNRIFDGVHREDWQDTAWVDGGTTVTITTAIPLEAAAALDDVDIILVIDQKIGAPVLSTPVKTRVNGLLVVTFGNTAAAGNMVKWTAKIFRNHSIVR